VEAGSQEFIAAEGSGGLWLRLAGGAVDLPAAAARAEVVKSGPLACSLRFVSAPADPASRVSWTVDLDFPRAKSWVRVTWTVADPDGHVAAMGAALPLRLPAGPALADFGAGSLVYAALAPGQTAVLRAGSAPGAPRSPAVPPWEVLRGPAGRLEPYVAGLPGAAGAVEGWAHAMDRERATAVAVADFAAGSRDAIEVAASGRLAISRDFAAPGAAPGPGSKTLTWWLHFVDMPPHVGAVTSPQSMLAPLEARWVE
jgi:hypothetical protein